MKMLRMFTTASWQLCRGVMMTGSRCTMIRTVSSATTTTTASKSRRLTKLLLISAGGFGSISLASYCFADRQQQRRIKDISYTINRLSKMLYFGSKLALHYWWQLRGLDPADEEYTRTMKQCHEYGGKLANHAVNSCSGLFIKFGQIYATMTNVIPEEYERELSKLYDAVPERREREVEMIFLEEFGKRPDEVFAKFDMKPMAAASLAQVHSATTHAGDHVAVKVQYINLRDSFPGDIFTVDLLVKFASWLHPPLKMSWLVERIAGNLMDELDFEHEGRNCEKCEESVRYLGYVKFPQIHWPYTTKRILTMEYMEGCKVTDTAAIDKLGLTCRDVANKVSRLFAEQLFVTGVLHSDPHPGNIFVRKGKDGKAELILLDHGLYQTLEPRLQICLRKMWVAMVLSDIETMKRCCSELSIPETEYAQFAEMLLMNPYYLNRPAGENMPRTFTKIDKQYMARIAQARMSEITQILEILPPSMLLVLRNFAAVRGITYNLGELNQRYEIMAECAAVHRDMHLKGLCSNLKAFFSRWSFTLTVKFNSLSFLLLRLYIGFLKRIGRIPCDFDIFAPPADLLANLN